MKVLFLDCDGVINCADTFRKPHDAHFSVDSYMAFLVGKIQLETNCQVVLSSSWRHHDASMKFIHERIVPLLDRTGSEPYDHNRPSGAENCQRGREIEAWFRKWNSEVVNEDITAYAILDDDSDMLPEQTENFFKTSWQTGLTKEIADRVIEHLNK